MALLSVIRRWHYRDHLSIREIARRTGLSRNTVRKHLRSDTVEPQFKVPERMKLGGRLFAARRGQSPKPALAIATGGGDFQAPGAQRLERGP